MMFSGGLYDGWLTSSARPASFGCHCQLNLTSMKLVEVAKSYLFSIFVTVPNSRSPTGTTHHSWLSLVRLSPILIRRSSSCHCWAISFEVGSIVKSFMINGKVVGCD